MLVRGAVPFPVAEGNVVAQRMTRSRGGPVCVRSGKEAKRDNRRISRENEVEPIADGRRFECCIKGDTPS